MTKVSVVIPTYNKAPLITDILLNLQEQTFKDFEVIVVDDGSVDKSYTQLRSLEVDYPLRVYETGLGYGTFGMCRAFNIGIARARGPITLLLNDDIYLHPTCIEQHVIAHKRVRPKHVFIGPRFKTPPYVLGELVKSKKLRERELKRYTENRGIGGYPIYRGKLMVSSNLSIDTRRLRWLGGYNEIFEYYSGEIDRELYSRMKAKSMETLFLWRAQAYSPRYWHPLYRVTRWLVDATLRDGLTVEQWKRRQTSKTARRLVKRAKNKPPARIEYIHD